MKRFSHFQCAFTLLLLPAFLSFAAGCASTSAGKQESRVNGMEGTEQGYVFYLDGVGGATAEKNWSGSVKEGLTEGGYQGTSEIFTWEKGAGIQANRDASVAYKRKRADELTWEIEDRLEEFPGAPVEIIGFSAGCDVVLYALEALPESVKVDNVVLLGATIDDGRDLTKALKRVKASLTLFTNSECAVPAGASTATGNLYQEKILMMPWDASVATTGGDRLKKEFVRDQVAPFLMGGGGFIFDFGAGAGDAGGGGAWLFGEE